MSDSPAQPQKGLVSRFSRKQSVSQSLPHFLLAGSTWPSHSTHTLLWSSFKRAAGISASSNADASSSFFWKVVVLQDGLLLLSLFTYLLVAGADFVESGGYFS